MGATQALERGTPQVSRERALAHGSRVALLSTLEQAAEPRDAGALAVAVGLHVNTVRSHLRVLERAELVVRSIEPRSQPGRPRVLYAAAAPMAADGGDRYRLLAQMLASFIAGTVPDPAAAAEETGRRWGHHLGPRPVPFTPTSEVQARTALLGLLDELGFAPRLEADPHEVALRHCPFRDVAEAHPEVACSLHLGLMRGAMAQLDAPLVIDALLPFVDPDRCVVRTSAAVAS